MCDAKWSVSSAGYDLCDQKQLWEQRVCFSLQMTEGKSGEELEAGTWRRDLMQ